MPEPNSSNPSPPIWLYTLLITPVILAVSLYYMDPLQPAELPLHELTQDISTIPRLYHRVLQGSELVGVGELLGPEDIAFDPNTQLIYTSCGDGWIKRLHLNNKSVVDSWVNTGGRPLGLAFGLDNSLIVADAFKGLLKVSAEGIIQVLTDEIEGRKMKFGDGVDVAKDGMIYFTEASYKYDLSGFIWDCFEGKPHGSLLSYDPNTGNTQVLLRDLYFANGVQISPDQKSVIFCETMMRRCKRYIREGERKGSVEIFVDNLPGFPDNIRYDKDGHYWIGFSTTVKPYWDTVQRYPVLRKGLAIITRLMGKRPHMEKNAGLIALDLQGKPVAYYYDPTLVLITGGNKLGDHIYFASLTYPYLIRFPLS